MLYNAIKLGQLFPEWSSSMLCFPQVKEVPLGRSPLKEVICQVRFPPLLRIVNEQPVDLQERVRARFPQIEVEKGLLVQGELLSDKPLSAKSEPQIFRFMSQDGNTVASLGLNFYALSTTTYTHWGEFLELVLFLTRTAREVYSLPYATRIGLRYINHLTLENTRVRSVGELWDIARPEITAMLRSECWDDPIGMSQQLQLAGEGDEKLTIRTGFTADESPIFLLDFDYYAEGHISLDDLATLCERYHGVIYRAFRWCIQEGKLAVFDPVAIDQGE